VLAIATVRTAGINWASVLTIVSAVVVIMTAVLGLLTRYVASKVTGSIDKFRIEVFDPLEGRVTAVEARQGVPRHRRGGRG
jgi:hypothetical protein